MDWKQVVKGAAPTLGALLTTFGGPAGALAGAGLVAVANALGVPVSGDVARDEEAVKAVVMAGLSPDQRAALVAADLEYKKAALAATTRAQELDADVEKAYLADVDSARKNRAPNHDLFVIACGVLVSWLLLTGATLYGLFNVASGDIVLADPGIAATVFTLLGSLIGYVSNIAQQVIGFFFGSSRGSDQKTTALAKAVAER